MSYWASFDGTIISNNEEDTAEILKIAKTHFTPNNFDNYKEHVYFYGNENYCDSNWEKFLLEIKPYVCYGSIDFSGEDDSFWRFHFVTSNWYEEQATIVYDTNNARLVGG